jgi:hypothetical protein
MLAAMTNERVAWACVQFRIRGGRCRLLWCWRSLKAQAAHRR